MEVYIRVGDDRKESLHGRHQHYPHRSYATLSHTRATKSHVVFPPRTTAFAVRKWHIYRKIWPRLSSLGNSGDSAASCPPGAVRRKQTPDSRSKVPSAGQSPVSIMPLSPMRVSSPLLRRMDSIPTSVDIRANDQSRGSRTCYRMPLRNNAR